MTAEDIGFLNISELGERYRDGRLTPLDVVRFAQERLRQLEPSLNAFAHPMTDLALAEADHRTAELAGGRDLGPLHGIPVAIKDLIEVAGAPTGYGTRACPPRIAHADAELVRRLRAAGAVIMGKTNLLEFAYGIAHPEIGQTNNPYDPARTSGGSSGGSAAAVAAGIVPLAIGTDTGGSIRVPAAYCGVVGLKPSFGLVPLDGVLPLSWTLDHAGPIARTVTDAAVALSILAATEMSPKPPPVAGLRLGLLTAHCASHEVTDDVRQCLDAAFAALRLRGAVLVNIEVEDLLRANRDLVTIVGPEASAIHAALPSVNPEGYAPRTRAQLESGHEVLAIDYIRAIRFREIMRDRIEAAFHDVDVLLSPSVAFVAPAEDPEIGDGSQAELLSSGIANFTGHPAISLPAGLSNQLPVGLQLMGRLGADRKLLSIAAAIEGTLPRLPSPKKG